MVKFGRHLATHLVPEWRYKFIDYKLLKKFLKRKVKSLPPDKKIFQNRAPYSGYVYKGSELLSTELRQVRYSTLSLSDTTNNILFTGADHGYEPFEVYIKFYSTSAVNLSYENEKGEIKFTLHPPEGLEEDIKPIEKEFFDKITAEINKVNVWYVSKIKEYENNLNQLSRQVDLYLSTNMSFYQKHKSTRKLQDAFKELYRGLRYLQNFAVLNEMGFSKVLKKHDKLIRFRSRNTVITLIHKLWFCRRPALESVINKTENLWAKAFYKGDRSNLKKLRQIPVKISYGDAFGIGVYTGFLIPLFLLLFAIGVSHPNWIEMRYFDTTFPIYRIILLGVLFMWGWGIDLYVCHKKGVNVTFIFDANVDSALNYLTCLLYAAGYSVILFTAFTLTVLIEMDYTEHWSVPLIEHYPFPSYWNSIILLIFFVIVMLGKTRKYLFKTIWNIIRAPFVDVHYQDFFLGDQFTSNRRFFTDLGSLFCIIPTKLFTHEDDLGECSSYYNVMIYFTMVIPYVSRLLQCLRSIFVHLRNALKYTLLSITAIIALTNSKILWAISATISTSYAIYWDLHEDWGLIEYNGNRIKIVPSNRMFKPYVYIVAGIIDIILRLTWLERIFDIPMNKILLDTSLAMLEILRRVIWNVFRLENEQLNNCGLFRATKDIPLPFDVDEMNSPVTYGSDDEDKMTISSVASSPKIIHIEINEEI